MLTISLEDMLSSKLDIRLGQVDGRLSCKLKPTDHSTHTDPSKSGAGISLNLESVRGENGMYTLILYASHDVDEPPSTVPSLPPSVASTPSDAAMFATPASVYRQMPDSDSFLLATDASPPSEYYASPLGFSTRSTSVSDDVHDAPKPFVPEWVSCLCRAFSCPVPTGAVFRFPNTTTIPLSRFFRPLPPIYVWITATTDDHDIHHHCTPTPPRSETDSITNDDSILRVTPGGNHRPGRRAQYPCEHPGCDRVLTSPYTRQVHMRTHRPKVRKAFVCTLGCGEAFTRQHDRQRHEVALHGKKCKDVCQRCKRFFSSPKMLERHVCRGGRQGAIQWPLSDDEVQSTLGTP
ncbi:hypothetical protein FB45DRAFT_1067823 [Roridomyces roridus]|uniref:C2H2-type domain-containing protein n=1 Tax=Roridomyces roridus TaxID=1738132 RepID=A0AAD7B201_9AGAR|nr:hypothetical protein FB45DRAFT_1067823 [Roridomyces roridus]